MIAIYKRELKSYFQTFIGFLFMGATLFLIGIYFTAYNLFYGYPHISYVVSSVVFLFFLSFPVLTMRVLAEEKKQKTDQLILTAPVSVGKVVVGKYLALLTIFAIPTAVICIYPVILSFFGTVPMGESYLAILGFFLYGAACIAIGVFVSSLTESQVISAVLAFAILFVGYMMEGICNLISPNGNMVTRILGSLDMYSRFANQINGTLNVASIIYFVSITVLVLFFTCQSIQKRRYSVSSKSLKFGAYSSGMVIVALIVTVFVNMVVAELPVSVVSIDLTSNKLYSLTDTTKDLVNSMQEDVTIYALVAKDSQDKTLGSTLQRYDDLSDHITVEYVDPAVNPRFYTQYTDGAITANSLIVVSDKRSKVINYSYIYETSYDYTNYTSNTTGYDGEGQITSALAYVLDDSTGKVYATTGHGELELSASFTDMIKKQNLEYASITLLNSDAIPEDTQCLVINAPTSDFSEEDANNVLDYLKAGGDAVVVSTWTDSNMPYFQSILDYYELGVTKGLVMESSQDNYYQTPYYLLPQVKNDTVTSGIYGSYYIFAPYSQGIIVPDTLSDDIEVTPLLSTTEGAFARADVENNSSVEMTDSDEAGPFDIGVKAVKTLEDGESTMFLYSCENLFTDAADQMVSGANLQLFNNSVSSLTNSETSVSVPVKSYEESALIISQSRIILLAVCSTIILPLGLLVAGFIIWFRRRKK